uniref:Secreted protein n=1 Tax=Lotharella globosa TaxID=91324 RepID=A0A7S3YZ46_9EUKA
MMLSCVHCILIPSVVPACTSCDRNNICGTRMSSRSSISRLALYPNIVSETAIDAENPNTSITHRHMQPLLSAAIVAPSSTYFDHYTVHLAYLGCSLLMLRTDK